MAGYESTSTHEGDLRAFLADERDRDADERDRVADERDRVADARDRDADARDLAATARNRVADERVRAAEAELAGLGVAMGTRAIIEQAKGMIMITLKVDEAAAFDVLVRRSQTSHLKLVDVAREVVRVGSSKR